MKSIYNAIDAVVQDFTRENIYSIPYIAGHNDEDEQFEDAMVAMLKTQGFSNDLFCVERTFGFESPGYMCDICSISWIDRDGIHLETFLLETY